MSFSLPRATLASADPQELTKLIESHVQPLEDVVNVDGGVRALSNPNIPCDPSGEPYASLGLPFLCVNFEKVFAVDGATAIYPVQGCYTNEATDAKRGDECSSFCVLNVGPGLGLCNYCAWMDNGELAYDCSNIFPDAACPIKNGNGECEDFTQWSCLQTPATGSGYSCEIFNTGDFPSPAFAYDDILNTDVTTRLFCANDVTGLDGLELCEDPFCSLEVLSLSIHPESDLPSCDSCKVLPKDNSNENSPRFSYDCLDAIPDLRCPILRADGSCQNFPTFADPEPENTTWWNVPSFLVESPDSIVDTEDDLEGTGWVLRNMDPTGFNVMMDIYDKIIMLLFATSITMLFPAFMSWQLKKGKAIPASRLGYIPSDFFSALKGFRMWQLSIPAVSLVLLIIAADFSHAIADAGLEFVAVEEEGPLMPVLNLGTHPDKRNHQPPLEVAGDPVNLRTSIQNKNLDEKRYEEARPQSRLIANYLSTIQLVALGESPFTKRNFTSWRYVERESYLEAMNTSFLSLYVDFDENPLVTMDSEIPLNCDSLEMAESKRISRGNTLFEEPKESTAWVPNCTLTAERPSGRYGESPNDNPQIIESLENSFPVATVDGGESFRLTKGNESFVSFLASPESKVFSRDRNNEAVRGRRFYDVDGMEIGNTTIAFESVFLATGISRDAGIFDSFQTDFTPRNEYALVAEIENANCPERPSGYSSDGVECMVTITLLCDTFPEDSATHFHPIYGPEPVSSRCDFVYFEIVWGKNFVADTELVSTVAGLFSMTKPSFVAGTWRDFGHHSILGASFALGLVGEAPSVDQVVRPRVNLVFVIFIALPVAVSIFLIGIALYAKRRSMPIPTEPWEFFIMGAENADLFPVRQDEHDPFPKVDHSLVFAAYLRERGEDGAVLSSEQQKDLPEDSMSETGSDGIDSSKHDLAYGLVRKSEGHSVRNWNPPVKPSSYGTSMRDHSMKEDFGSAKTMLNDSAKSVSEESMKEPTKDSPNTESEDFHSAKPLNSNPSEKTVTKATSDEEEVVEEI